MATTAKTHKCPECGRKFSRPQSLGIHRRTEHGVIGGSPAAARARALRSANGGANAKRTTTKRAAAKRATTTRSTSKRAAATRSTTKRAATKRSTARRATTKRATAKRTSTARARTTQRNGASPSMATGLLAIVFPNGFPADERVLRETIAWLGEAERLAALA